MRIIEEKYNWNGGFKVRSKTDYIVLHHPAASTCTAQDIHRWHLANGWTGIGYHLFVRKDGSIYRGRPLDTVGAHVLDYNDRSVGICAEGDYTKEQMPGAQKQALTGLVDYLKGIYPAARILGHCDLMPTACPGDNFPLAPLKEDDGREVVVEVRGKKIPGRLIDGATWVPLRDIIIALSWQIAWDEGTKTARVK